MVTYIWVNTGLGCGLCDGAKALPEPMLTYHQRYSVEFTRSSYEHNSLAVGLSIGLSVSLIDTICVSTHFD